MNPQGNTQVDAKARIDQVDDPSGRPVTVLRFSGDLSSNSRDAVLGSYEKAPKERSLLLDFSRVDYVNSSGIALVIQMMMAAGKSSHKVAIFGLTPHFQKVFTMVGITRYAGIYPDERAALASLSADA